MRLLLILCCITVTWGGPSPHADLVQKYVESEYGGRFSNNIIADALTDVPGLISRYNYPVEVHTVTTPDGYVLQMHRIPHGRDRNNRPGNKTAVFLQHGMLSSSADYVIVGPENSLAYRLAEEGYDVWMGNARGNYYSRKHTHLDPDDRSNLDFWRFSWEEIGSIDMPTCIDYILDLKGHKKLHFVGFSQGGTVFLVMGALRPEYSDKIISFQGLAPASYFVNNEYGFIQAIAPYEKVLMVLAADAGIGEFLGRSNIFTALGIAACSDQSFLQPLCLAVPILGNSFQRLNATMLPAYIGHAPAGMSIRQLAHYGQSINNKSFRRYDLGLAGNMQNYGQFYPPEYDLSGITCPSYIHYSYRDKLVNYRDVELMSTKLGGPVTMYPVEDRLFTHLDFCWGVDQVKMYHGNVLEGMRLAENL
ncbi:lipase 1 [Plutella xylostella]|uniref:lipase 1 n=1 Tax=Plutella xylostella TaxID=51655 RepID=UPI002032E30E|nr:lipase 1 [Plutella xylostella]